MSEITTGLLITGIGMGLVFAMIIILWGLMALLVKLTSRKSVTKEDNSVVAESIGEESLTENNLKAAAAAAVAYVLSKDSQTVCSSFSSYQDSNWQSLGRLRQIQNKPGRGS